MTVTTLDSEPRLLASRAHPGSGGDLAGHLALHGPLDIPEAGRRAWAEQIAGAIDRSGLLGRGGGGFPTGTKWRSVQRGLRSPMVVVNAMEGEPASAKDRVLLEDAPHLVLDGADVAAAVVGASEIVICVPDHAGSPAASIEAAIAQRKTDGHRHPRVSVQRPPGRYLTGEESALVGWLEKGRVLPVFRSDKSVPLNVRRRPTLVHNAETLAQVALIARRGPDWFRGVGIPGGAGSTLVTVSGAVTVPGVVEVALGTPVVDIVRRAGIVGELSAVLIGGYGGAWLDASAVVDALRTGPSPRPGPPSASVSSIALPATSCGIAETARMARYLAERAPASVARVPLVSRPSPTTSNGCGSVGRTRWCLLESNAGPDRSKAEEHVAIPTAWPGWCGAPSRCSRPTPTTMRPGIRAPGPALDPC